MLGFLVNETMHVPLEFAEDCSQCWVWILSFCIMHWDLLQCARELFLSGTLPQCSVDIYTLGLVPSHCQVYVCLGAALWADRRDKFNILGFSVTSATNARISVLSLYQASPVLAFFVVVKTGCVPCTWQNVVADSHGIQAGRVSKPEGDPGEGSLGCSSVLSRCPLQALLTHCGRLSPAAQHGQHVAEVTAEPVRICRQNLQAGPRYQSLPQCGASWQAPGVLCTLAFSCLASVWAFCSAARVVPAQTYCERD